MGYLLQKLRSGAQKLRQPSVAAAQNMMQQPPEDTNLGRYILGSCESATAEEYAREHLARLIRTLEVTPSGSSGDRVLEMGAYMQITPALRYKLGYGEVRGCNLGPSGEVVHKTTQTADGKRFECDVDLFNAEREPFPYPDEHFTTVICCELLEHLNEDPMRMMAEINRVTKPGGWLVMTTPNICSTRGVAAILTGFQPQQFSQYLKPNADATLDPKHSREYAPRELGDLLRDAGYNVDRLETGPCGSRDMEKFEWVLPFLEKTGYPTELRDEGIYVVGSKNGPVQDRYPSWLYA
jgi:SAM-dependent methyltransferase